MTEPELREYFSGLARMIEKRLPDGPSKNGKCLFVLVCADDSGIGQYISNAERSGIIKLLRETADRLERRRDVTR